MSFLSQIENKCVRFEDEADSYGSRDVPVELQDEFNAALLRGGWFGEPMDKFFMRHPEVDALSIGIGVTETLGRNNQL